MLAVVLNVTLRNVVIDDDAGGVAVAAAVTTAGGGDVGGRIGCFLRAALADT